MSARSSQQGHTPYGAAQRLHKAQSHIRATLNNLQPQGCHWDGAGGAAPLRPSPKAPRRRGWFGANRPTTFAAAARLAARRPESEPNKMRSLFCTIRYFWGHNAPPKANYSKLTFGSTRPVRLGGGRAGGWCGAQACGCGSNRYKPTHPPPKEDAPAGAGKPSRPTPGRRWFARGKRDRRTNPRLMPHAQSSSIAQNG